MQKIMFGTAHKEVMDMIQPIAQVMGVHIELVDRNGIRIIGSGLYKYRIGDQINELVYNKVLKDEKLVIVENPGNHSICKGCTTSIACMQKLIMGAPVYFKNEVIGVLAFLCFDENKKNIILNDVDNYGQVLQNLGDSISARYYQNDFKEVYQELFTQIGKAVLITREDGIILEYNRSAHVIFSKLQELEGKKVFLEKEVKEDEFKISISGIEVRVKGHVNTTKDGKVIIIFSSIEEHELKKMSDGILLGKSKVVMNLGKKLKKVSETGTSILITGETGTDKEMFAKWIHNLSNRKNQKFAYINCREEKPENLGAKIFGAGLDINLELGLFETVDKGTVFLDEIDCLPINLQKKLLYFINTSKILPVDREEEIEVDVRVIAGTRNDLIDLINKNLFLENLYYKLSSMIIEIPSMQYRKDDMDEIIDFLIERYEKYYEKKIKGVDAKAKRILIEYDWTGNWKEIENTIKLIVDLTEEGGTITEELIPESIKIKKNNYMRNFKKIRRLSEIEREEIIAALSQFGFETEGKRRAAAKLGIGIATLYRKIESYQIDKKMISGE
ncbi:MAG: sigma 54-interacting transcriptional regulator [Fusobacteriaceae bacterium]